LGNPVLLARRTGLAQARELLITRAYEFVQKLIAFTEDDKDAPPCPLCGRGMRRNDAVKTRTLAALLDRAGLGPTTKVEVTQKSDVEWLQYLPDDRLAQLMEWIEDAEMARLSAAEPQLVGESSTSDVQATPSEEAPL